MSSEMALDTSRWVRLVTAAIAAATVVGASTAHPLAPELILMVRGARARQQHPTL